jgi:nucleotide-binding universal stress UspA family protein
MRPMPIERILIGVDGSDDSRRALEWAVELAGRLGAEVVAVHALGLLEQLDPGGEPVPTASHRDEIVRVFEQEWCAPLDAGDVVRSRRLVEDGPPAMVLLRVAEQEGVDLVVVGSRGIGGFDELLLGSTSTQVMHHSPVPVTVIPRADRAVR